MPNNSEVTQHYRETTLGSTLQQSLDDLYRELRSSVGPSSIPEDSFKQLKEKVLEEFDKEMNDKLNRMAKNRLSINAELTTYRHCDSVWQMVLQDVTIQGQSDKLDIDKIKIVACENKSVGKKS